MSLPTDISQHMKKSKAKQNNPPKQQMKHKYIWNEIKFMEQSEGVK